MVAPPVCKFDRPVVDGPFIQRWSVMTANKMNDCLTKSRRSQLAFGFERKQWFGDQAPAPPAKCGAFARHDRRRRVGLTNFERIFLSNWNGLRSARLS